NKLRGPRIIAVAGNLGDLWGEQHGIETRTKPNHSWVNSGRLTIGGNYSRSPQFYYHRDRGLNRAMMQRAKEAGVEVMMLTVDSITGGNRERDLRTGFSIPFR